MPGDLAVVVLLAGELPGDVVVAVLPAGEVPGDVAVAVLPAGEVPGDVIDSNIRLRSLQILVEINKLWFQQFC